MIGYDLYRIYEPIRLHFESSYDIFKYKGVLRYGKREQFEKRNDHLVFEKFAKHIHSHKAAGQICLSNFVYNNRDWIYHDPKEVNEVYNRWRGVLMDVKMNFSDQVDNIISIAKDNDVDPETMFKKTPTGKQPPALQLFMHGKIHKETLVILSNFSTFLTDWIEQYDFDPLISDQLFLLKKYKPFIVTRENQRDFYEAARLIFRTNQV
jgi:hypothetical protein